MKIIDNTFKLLAACFLFILFTPSLKSQEVGIGQWRDLLPYNYATSLDEMGNYIFCSTPYSLFYFDRGFNSVHRLSKVNGLSDIGVSKVSYNEDQKIMVVAYTNTNLDLIDEKLDIINIPDIKRKEILGNKTINSIFNYGKYAYLSCGFGIVVVNLEKKEIRDTYFIGPDGTSINVYEMTADEVNFYAATEQGIYFADKSNPNLAYFANWSRITDIPDPSDTYNHVHYFGGYLFANHFDPEDPEDNLLILENGSWRELENEGTSTTYSLRSDNERLVISYSYFVKVYDANLNEQLKIYTYGDGSPAPSDGIMGSDGFNWTADRVRGLVKTWGDGFQHQFIIPSGAPTTDAFEMTCQEGNLWLVPGGLSGTWNNIYKAPKIYSFINEIWRTYDHIIIPELDSLRDMVSVTVDPLDPGRVYAGSWFIGLVELKDFEFSGIYASGNSTLQIHEYQGPPIVKVGGTAYDADHSLWVVNSGAQDILSVRRDGGTWESYNLGAGTVGIDVREIIVDSYGQKWLIPRTTQSNPNYLYVFNEMNPQGTQVKGLRSGAGFGNLPGTGVFAIAEDLEGEVWVGTDEGIAVFYSPQEVLLGDNPDAQRILVDFDGYVQYLLETETVKAIAIDGANRKWIGTERAGVFLLEDDGTEQVYHFTAETSPLLSNTIISLAINDKTGEVYIGTDKGIIGYKSTATEGGETNTGVYAYPNPVRPGYDGPIGIKGLVRDAYVKITDVNGTLIYETRAEGGQAVWNGYNFDGRRANSGVYLVFITDSDGKEEMVTKILFIN
jgi:hypothetical protein